MKAGDTSQSLTKVVFKNFLNYKSMITHSQEIWKIQNRVRYSLTIYYNYFIILFFIGE